MFICNRPWNSHCIRIQYRGDFLLHLFSIEPAELLYPVPQAIDFQLHLILFPVNPVSLNLESVRVTSNKFAQLILGTGKSVIINPVLLPNLL
ncbi:hypothetical protein D9M69_581130 [compost metagenome]